MTRVVLILFQEYGFQIAQLGVTLYCFWKLFTNHLKHMSEDIEDVRKEVTNNTEQLKKLDKDVAVLSSKTQTLEKSQA